MRISRVRSVPPQGVGYRLGLALHCRYDLDSQLSNVDLTTLCRGEIRAILAGVERTTGLSTGALAYDAELEDE